MIGSEYAFISWSKRAPELPVKLIIKNYCKTQQNIPYERKYDCRPEYCLRAWSTANSKLSHLVLTYFRTFLYKQITSVKLLNAFMAILCMMLQGQPCRSTLLQYPCHCGISPSQIHWCVIDANTNTVGPGNVIALRYIIHFCKDRLRCPKLWPWVGTMQRSYAILHVQVCTKLYLPEVKHMSRSCVATIPWSASRRWTVIRVIFWTPVSLNPIEKGLDAMARNKSRFKMWCQRAIENTGCLCPCRCIAFGYLAVWKDVLE